VPDQRIVYSHDNIGHREDDATALLDTLGKLLDNGRGNGAGSSF
jgi:hypothetical protein